MSKRSIRKKRHHKTKPESEPINIPWAKEFISDKINPMKPDDVKNYFNKNEGEK